MEEADSSRDRAACRGWKHGSASTGFDNDDDDDDDGDEDDDDDDDAEELQIFDKYLELPIANLICCKKVTTSRKTSYS